MIETDFKFYKNINDNPEFAKTLNDILFDRYATRREQSEEKKESKE